METAVHIALLDLQEKSLKTCPHGWFNPVQDCQLCWWANRRLAILKEGLSA